MITKHYFGSIDQQQVYYYTMKNAAGMEVSVCEFGGAIMRISVPDKYNRHSDVVGGYDSLRDYVLGDGYQGALIGRTGNRIARGRFTLDGETYRLFINNGPNSLHGGKVGYSHRMWNVKAVDGDEPHLILTLHSEDGEENYPGNLYVTVTYSLLTSNALSIRYEATTDRKTPVNLTNHVYFNLGGYASGKIYDHVLQMDADAYLPTDDTLIPTGEIRSVAGTPFDFREPKTIGRDFLADNEDLKIAGGYDHCFCFAGGETKEPVLRVEVYEPNSGRIMKVFTNQPCVQFYTGNFLTNAEHPFKGGLPQNPQIAFCLETQKMPDSVNHSNFTNVILEPGETYEHTTIYQFSVKQ
ncbi:MAG: galactose mutarotase [Ruminococcaceae bacterium]|nr:galactose mutarotase [Oscillospiraceae bacterium]